MIVGTCSAAALPADWYIHTSESLQERVHSCEKFSDNSACGSNPTLSYMTTDSAYVSKEVSTRALVKCGVLVAAIFAFGMCVDYLKHKEESSVVAHQVDVYRATP